MLLTTFWEVIGGIMFALLVCIPILLLWGFALFDLFVRRDVRLRKLLYLFGIVLFPIFGSLIYLAFRGPTALGVAASYADTGEMPEGLPS